MYKGLPCIPTKKATRVNVQPYVCKLSGNLMLTKSLSM
nr:MAG TPA: hypothetical protein [Caudoviricetes sp.]